MNEERKFDRNRAVQQVDRVRIAPRELQWLGVPIATLETVTKRASEQTVKPIPANAVHMLPIFYNGWIDKQVYSIWILSRAGLPAVGV